RAGAADFLVETCRVDVGPHLGARASVVANNGFVVATLFLRVGTVTDHGKGRPAGPDPLLPHKLRRMSTPVGDEADAFELAIAVEPADPGPISRLQFHRLLHYTGRCRTPARQIRQVALFVGLVPAIADLGVEIAPDAVQAQQIAVSPAEKNRHCRS